VERGDVAAVVRELDHVVVRGLETHSRLPARPRFNSGRLQPPPHGSLADAELLGDEADVLAPEFASLSQLEQPEHR
jgi:hypothetical protein